jgi:hypothetical protein
MYARHVTVHGSAENVDEGIRMVREEVLPVLQQCQGFQGQLMLVDRAKGEAIGISLWDTEEDMNASEEKVNASRQQAVKSMGSSGPEISNYELPIYETP